MTKSKTNESGVALIKRERLRQISKEGWTSEHDDSHTGGELALAACCYATPRRLYVKGTNGFGTVTFTDPWPFGQIQGSRYRGDWDKRKKFRRGNYPLWPTELDPDQRLDLLVKAGALIAAEIDRLLRVKAETQESDD